MNLKQLAKEHGAEITPYLNYDNGEDMIVFFTEVDLQDFITSFIDRQQIAAQLMANMAATMPSRLDQAAYNSVRGTDKLIKELLDPTEI